jgi:hypothetical protein
MGKIMLRRKEVASIVLRTTAPGSRAVFLIEARTAEERRKVRELFAALGELGEVFPLCDGPMMAYAAQLHGQCDAPPVGSLFTKIEAALKDEFAFSLVEHSFNEVVYQLVESLCADSGGTMKPVPRCGICNEPEPFPTRITLHDQSGKGIIEACYCAHCAALRADPSDKELVVGLLSADRRGFRGIQDADLVEWSADGEAGAPLPTYRIAS